MATATALTAAPAPIWSPSISVRAPRFSPASPARRHASLPLRKECPPGRSSRPCRCAGIPFPLPLRLPARQLRAVTLLDPGAEMHDADDVVGGAQTHYRLDVRIVSCGSRLPHDAIAQAVRRQE